MWQLGRKKMGLFDLLYLAVTEQQQRSSKFMGGQEREKGSL